MIGGSPEGSPAVNSGEVKSNGSAIVAFEKLTGKIRYQCGNDLASYATPVFGSIDGERRGFAFARGGLMSFHPQSGKIGAFFPWRAKKLESVNASTPIIVDDTIFITESYGPGGALLRIKPTEFEPIWRDPPKRDQSMASHWSTPIYHQGYLYGCSGQSAGNAELRCIEYETGKIMWRKPGWGRSTLLYVDGHLIVLSERGDLFLVKAEPQFNLIAEAKLGASKSDPKPALLHFPAWNAPVISNHFLYLRGKDSLICLDLLSPATKR